MKNRKIHLKNPPPVRTKLDFLFRFGQGEFGNCAPDGEVTPTEKVIFQGQAIQSSGGLSLLFTTRVRPIEEALVEYSEEVRDSVALLLLKHYLNPKSFDWLDYLLRNYPDHSVGFSTYSVCWGTLPGYNTTFWEVRKY